MPCVPCAPLGAIWIAIFVPLDGKVPVTLDKPIVTYVVLSVIDVITAFNCCVPGVAFLKNCITEPIGNDAQ